MKRGFAAVVLVVVFLYGQFVALTGPTDGVKDTAIAAGCKAPLTPVDAEAGLADAVATTVSGVCSLIEGVDSNGTVATICAYVTEVVDILVPFILTLRGGDAGAPQGCTMLPGTSFCATPAERAKAINFLIHVRQSRLMLDAGRAK